MELQTKTQDDPIDHSNRSQDSVQIVHASNSESSSHHSSGSTRQNQVAQSSLSSPICQEVESVSQTRASSTPSPAPFRDAPTPVPAHSGSFPANSINLPSTSSIFPALSDDHAAPSGVSSGPYEDAFLDPASSDEDEGSGDEKGSIPRRQRRPCALRFFGGYASYLIRFPYLILFFVVLVSTTLTLIAFFHGSIPNFENPGEGFAPRHSELSKRLNTWSLFRERSGIENVLAFHPQIERKERAGGGGEGGSNGGGGDGGGGIKSKTISAERKRRTGRSGLRTRDNRRKEKNLEKTGLGTSTNKNKGNKRPPAPYFCDIPRPNYAHVSLSCADENDPNCDLLSLDSIRDSCLIERVVTHQEQYKDICLTQPRRRRRCCRSWSLGNYVAKMSNKFSCELITAEDVAKVRQRLRRCAPPFIDGSLTDSCWNEEAVDVGVEIAKDRVLPWCRRLPLECVRGNDVFYFFQYIAEAEFSAKLAKRQNALNQNAKRQNELKNPREPSYSNQKEPQSQDSDNLNKPESSDAHHPDEIILLRNALTFLPMTTGSFSEPIYSNMSSRDFRLGGVRISSIEFGLKYSIFDDRVKTDAAFLSAALFAIFIVTWIFTKSILITFFSLIQIALSLGVSYFVYTVVFAIKVFPFMNLLTIVILLGVGTDDTFVFVTLWRKFQLDNQQSRRVDDDPISTTAAAAAKAYNTPTKFSPIPTSENIEREEEEEEEEEEGAEGAEAKRTERKSATPSERQSESPSKTHQTEEKKPRSSSSPSSLSGNDIPVEWHHRLSLTLRHSFLAMFATSFTTSAAFMASFVASDIVAVRAFSLFASVSVMANLFFTLTILPSVALLHLRYFSSYPFFNNHCLPSFGIVGDKTRYKTIILRAKTYCLKLIYFLVTHAGVASLTLLTLVVALSVFIVFGSPGLALPSSANFQVFPRSNLMEKYDMEMKLKFRFASGDEEEESEMGRMPITIMWGVKAASNGAYYDTYDLGSLEYDPSFNISSPESQIWMLQFCRNLRRQPFYGNLHGGLQLSNCFLETLVDWMKSPCEDSITGEDLRPCCNESSFPYSRHALALCMGRASKALARMRGVDLYEAMPGPRYNPLSGEILTFTIQFDSNQPFSRSHADMDRFFLQVDNWTRSEMASAPPGLNNGWFVSFLDFYALQESLWWGTRDSLLIALGLVLIVMVIATSSFRVAVFALITIAAIILVTAAILVVAGWDLNVLESVTLTVGIGLAIDTTLHYAVAFRLQQPSSPSEDAASQRRETVTSTLTTMAPAVTLASFTTALAGAMMTPASILAYVQLGVFLVVIMLTSWVFSTFFFLSLLRYFGTVHKTNQPWRSSLCVRF